MAGKAKKSAKASSKPPKAAKKTSRKSAAPPKRKIDKKAGEHPHTNRPNPEGMKVLGPSETPSGVGLEAHRNVGEGLVSTDNGQVVEQVPIPAAGSKEAMPTAKGGPPEMSEDRREKVTGHV